MSFTRYGSGRGPRKGQRCEAITGRTADRKPTLTKCSEPATLWVAYKSNHPLTRGRVFEQAMCEACANRAERYYLREDSAHHMEGIVQAFRQIAAEHEGEPWTAELLERADACEKEAKRRAKELEDGTPPSEGS